MKQGWNILILLSLLFASTLVQAQVPPVPVDTENQLLVDVDFPDGPELFISNYGERADLLFRVMDKSTDSAEGSAGQSHKITVTAEPIGNPEGWQYNILGGSFSTIGGQSQDVRLSVLLTGDAVEQELRFRINVTLEADYCCGTAHHESTVLIRSPGSQFAFLRQLSEATPTVSPDEVFVVKLNVINPGLLDRTYRLDEVSNSCELFVTDATVFVPAGESREVDVTVLAPSGKLYYMQETCNLSVQMVDLQSNLPSNTATFSIKVQGAYVDPGWIINAVIILAVIAVIIWLILLAKRRAEEEVLGKPQPPWTLPAEQVYLAELQKKDPQAAYVVRHFLMEDEYASSLMWYKAYKKSTKGRRRAERKALKIEHDFEKWDLRMQAQLANTADTDKQVAKLQAKLDRKTKKAHKKEHKKWKKQVSKLETKAANDHNKAMNEHRKAAKKAAKKGEPVPKQPTMAQPDLPPEPQMEEVDVDDHPRFAKKKQRVLDRASKNEERAEANYERLRAKKVEATQRKLAKLAEDIDDPAFVEEHPMLKDAVASGSA